MQHDGEVSGSSDDNFFYRQSPEGEEEETEWDDEAFLQDDKLNSSEFNLEFRDTDFKSSVTINETQERLQKFSVIEQRLNTLAQLKKLWEERRQLKWKNNLLHKKCRDYFIKSKIMKCFEKSLIASNIHTNPRYEAVLDEYSATKTRLKETEICYTDELRQLKAVYDTHVIEFEEVFNALTSRQLEIGVACFEKSPKQSKSAHRMVLALLNRQQQRLDNLVEVRVNYLKLHNCSKSIHGKLDELNILGGGHTLIDYESLVMNKSVSVEKLDERDEELGKIRNKCFSILHASQ